MTLLLTLVLAVSFGWLSPAFVSPIAHPNPPITRAFGEPSPRGFHVGVDLGVPCGTEVRAMADGMVVLSVNRDPDGIGARRLVLRHDDELHIEYSHLRRNLVTHGSVTRGQIVALSGRDNDRTDCHLHVAARRGTQPEAGYTRVRPTALRYVDPLAL